MTKSNMSIFSAAESKTGYAFRKKKKHDNQFKACFLPSFFPSGMLARKTQLTFRIAKTVHF